MIPLKLAPEPKAFDEAVRLPGRMAISEMAGKQPIPPRTCGKAFKQRKKQSTKGAPNGYEADFVTCEEEIPPSEFPDYWRHALDDLKAAYNHICSYSCFRIHAITGVASVDHMIPKSKSWQDVYEWDNYRLACTRMNSRKYNFTNVLDPMKIGKGWFELELVGFQVCPGQNLSRSLRNKVQQTIDQLDLNGTGIRDHRQKAAEFYLNQEIKFYILLQEAPFVALELCRQDKLLPIDRCRI